ncbi:MAG TPA: S9 family peptidase, partial [Caldithrix abyssi]|nr:S9 family peptidase [Caldithrix abyssi]
VFIADADGQNIKDVTPGDYDTPPLDLGSGHDYTFSPDGKEICFVRNTDPMVAASTNNDLFIEDLATGKISRLTANKGNDNNPNYSPDGRYIAYASMERAGFEADRQRLMLYDRQTKATRELTKGFDLSVSSILWSPDGKEIYFTVAENGSISLYRVAIADAKITPVLKGHYISAVQFAGKNQLVFKEQSEAMPYEIFSLDLKSGKRTRLTHINDERLKQLALSQLEPFSFTGAKGDVVHGFIMKPPFFDPNKKYPAIELIHGGPQGAWTNDFHYRWNYQMFAAPGYVIFMINFHGSRGYGQAFTDAVSKDWGGAPYRDILIGTEYVLSHYPFIDRERVGAAGASYGGFMINWIAGADNPFKCLVSHDGVYEQVSMYGATEELWFPEWEFNGTPWQKGSLYQKWNPANRAANFKTPTLVIHGEHDYRVPYTQGLQMFTALQRQGVESKLLFFPDEDHFVRKPQNARLWWKTVHEWFASHLK